MPPISSIRGVDLVTEGVVTISKVLKIGEGLLSGADANTDWTSQKDGASLVAQELF